MTEPGKTSATEDRRATEKVMSVVQPGDFATIIRRGSRYVIHGTQQDGLLMEQRAMGGMGCHSYCINSQVDAYTISLLELVDLPPDYVI